jgi:hypothetical protein
MTGVLHGGYDVSDIGSSKEMDYLVVLFSLASMGAAFAAAKMVKRGKKHLTRLEL